MAIYKKVNKYYLPALFFLVLSLLLIFAWFKGGHFYGGGDVGLPTYNPIRIFQIAKFIWWEAVAPGFLLPGAITSVTLYFFLALLQLFGIGAVGIQAILFLILLFLMGFGMYLLTLSIIGQDKKIYAIIAGLFYMFNPYMMTQIWHRFIFTSFVFVAAIPFLILLWRLWIKSGKYLLLLSFLIVNLFANYMFGTLAFVFPFWLIMVLFTIPEIFLPWVNKAHFVKVIWRFGLGLIIWVLFNGWWLIPIATVSQGIASQQHDIGESISTLLTISKQAILPYSLQMGNSYYLFDHAELGQVYKSFFFRLIPWLGVAMIFYGIIYSLKRKHLSSLVLIYLVIILLAKGTSPPFGQFFLWLFSKSFIFGLLRNPFEKIGILLPLVSSILFAISVEGFFSWSGKYLGNLSAKLIIVILFTIMGVYYWPMYQGKIFGAIDQPNYVEIPQSYKDVDNWLNQQVHQNSKIDGKILHLPLTRSDIVTYKWEYGYHGVESSSLIFTSLPSISRGVSLKNIDDGLTALSLIFHNPYNLHQGRILKLLQDFNVRFIILHRDIVWKGADIYDPEDTEKLLNTLPFLKREKQFGDLVIYEILPEYFKPKIVLTNAINFVYPQQALMRMWPYLISENLNDFISPLDNNDARNIITKSNSAIIFPSISFSYLEATEKGMDYVANNLASYLNILANSKVFANKSDEMDVEELIGQIILTGEDLINTYILIKNNNFIQSDSLIRRYVETIDKLFKRDLRKPKLSFYVSPSMINDVFKLHLLILEQIEVKLNPEQSKIINSAKNRIKQDLNSYNLLPVYPLAKRENLVIQERQINQYNLTKKGEYELLMVNPQSRDIYPNKLASLDFQVNGREISLKANNKGDLISFGNITLNEALQEISFNHLISENQFPSPDQLIKKGDVKIIDKNTIQLTSDGVQPAYIDSQLHQIEGEELYLVTFEALIQSGTGFYIQVIQDTDAEQNGRLNPSVKATIYRNPQNSNWQMYRIQLPVLNLTTREAVFRLIVDPLGTTSFNDSTGNQPTVVLVKNMQVGRILNNPIYLYSKSQIPVASASAKIIELNKESPVLYTGIVRTDQPTFLIFKEAFDFGWKLELKKQNKIYKMDQHFIANLYGNAWWIDQIGEYNFKIEFEPQRKVTIGLYITIFGGGVLIFLIIFQKFKKNERN